VAETNIDKTIPPTATCGADAGGQLRGWIYRSHTLRRVVKSGPVQSQIKTARALSVVRGGTPGASNAAPATLLVEST
jgi:hypothetical protein